ncbi:MULTISPECIES: PfaB family protein [Pseudomonadati]|uniref:PfaB family protein n=1 Tax=Shewanella aestuarii TaxID=1028752 RepID=A0ABT0L5X2_9GAMM|nr:PfaB family protein [Shewanella aestuarii]MCL1118820.1 PfaB family protein [Shewanella aestuarii]
MSALTSKELAEAVKQRHLMPMRIAVLLNPPNPLPQVDSHTIAMDGSNLLGFEQALASAAQLLSEKPNMMVNLADALWLIPALFAAKNNIHPHAFINGVGIATNSDEAVKQALTHAKRLHIAPIVHTAKASSAKHKLQQLHALVSAIAHRQTPQSATYASEDNVAEQPYWFCDFHQSRVAAFSSSMSADSHQAVILTQGTEVLTANPLLNQHRLWLPIGAATVAELQIHLAELAQQLAGLNDVLTDGITDKLDGSAVSLPLLHLIKQQLAAYSANVEQHKFTAVVMATSFAALCAEVSAIQNALAGINANEALHYKTPAGSCVTTVPLGDKGLSFVFPGVGTVYPNMLKHLGHTFPALYAELEKHGDLQAMLQSQHIYAPEGSTQNMSLSELAISGVGASYILTKLLTKTFNIKPKLALGYSMGEASMWASLDVWQQPHSLIDATQTSSIFTQDISGPLHCVRQDWQLLPTDEIVWNSFVTRATPEELAPYLAEYPRAYIAIIQGDTCVVAGCEASCKALLKQAGKRGIASNKVTAMHTLPAMQIIEQVQQFYHQPLMDAVPDAIKFISATEAQPIKLTSDAIAQSIADTFCHQLNFTQLIAKAYQHGSRLFVEMGADRQTTTLIDKILPSQACHQAQAIAVNAKGADECISLLKCLGQLLSHQVPMSFTPFIDSIDCAIASLQAYGHSSLSTETPHLISEGEPH